MIVCLGWGSLIWNPGNLKIEGEWQKNGPNLPIEFARQSLNGRLTLVIEGSAPCVTVLWAEVQCLNITDASENLRKREGTNSIHIGTWSAGEKSPSAIPELSSWAAGVGATAVVWTALPPKFMGQNGLSPTKKQALVYLDNLEGEQRKSAEEYIRRAPQQIATPYRSLFELKFGWTAY